MAAIQPSRIIHGSACRFIWYHAVILNVNAIQNTQTAVDMVSHFNIISRGRNFVSGRYQLKRNPIKRRRENVCVYRSVLGVLPVRPLAALWQDSARRSACILYLCLVWIFIFTGTLAEAVTLNECIHEALARNPDATAAAMRVNAARAFITETGSAYFPQLSVAGTYAATDNPTQAFMMQLNQRTLDINRRTLILTTPVTPTTFGFPPVSNIGFTILVSAECSPRVSSWVPMLPIFKLQSVRNELIYQVTRGYFGVLQALDFVTVQQETVASLEESLQTAQSRVKAGAAVKTDVLNLEVQLAQAQENLIRAQNGADPARLAALNAAMGTTLSHRKTSPCPKERPRRPRRAISISMRSKTDRNSRLPTRWLRPRKKST